MYIYNVCICALEILIVTHFLQIYHKHSFLLYFKQVSQAKESNNIAPPFFGLMR